MKFRAYRQLEHSDCGITCIRMIARHFGKRIPMRQLRSMVDYSRIGVSIADILNCARQLGMRAHAVRIGMEQLSAMPLPAILYWDQKHYVVLYAIDPRKDIYYIADPAQGKLRLGREEFCRHWMGHDAQIGVAVVMAPTEAFEAIKVERGRNRRALWRMLKDSVRKNRRSFMLLGLLSLVSIAADVILPLVFQRTIDDGIGNRDIALVWLLVLSQLCVFAGNFVANAVNELVLTRLGLNVSIGMMNEYLAKLIRLPVSFFDKKVNSDFIQKIDDQNRLKGFLVSMPQTLFLTLLNMAVFSVMLIYYSPWVFAIFIVSTALSFGWTRLFLARRREFDYAQFSYASENRNNIYELVNGMPEIKVNNAQEIRVSVWKRLQEKINRLTMRLSYLNLTVGAGNSLFSQMKDITITGLCATMVIWGDMTIGVMMTISYIAGRLAYPFDTIVASISAVQDASLSYERLDEILNNTDEEQPPEQGLTFRDTSIRLQDLSFKYPGSQSPMVLKGLSALIESGKTTAIVGESGCGKSTFIKLLLGFYLPTEGSILAGGHNLSEINRDEWMRHCGVVNQSGYIFSGTILDNICMCDETPDLQRAREAATSACIHDFISCLPMGYHTKTGNAGVELSGGQKQRLLIARAIYKQPEVMLLDEATSSLDASTERRIVDNLTRLSQGRTVVIAAHRLSTVRHADKILYMEQGRITEQGTHEELIALAGGYSDLVRQQL